MEKRNKPGKDMIDMKEVLALTGFERTWIWRLRREGRFPQGVQYNGPASPNWFKRAEVLKWLKENGK